MLLRVTLTHPPATDLGFLLHKHPARTQSFDLSFGRAHVFYPEATEERCTAALLLDVDPVAIIRGRSRFTEGLLDQYVNDRPYVASSFMSVAIAQVFSTAMAGRCAARPDLVGVPLPLSAHLSALPCRGGEPFVRRVFEPLGYRVAVTRHPLDERFPEWGESPYYAVDLEGTVPLADLLTHLYVLIPVLDVRKHYWIGEDEMAKLLEKGAGWLASHPEREAITKRYLKQSPSLVRQALARLAQEDDRVAEEGSPAEEGVERGLGLNEERLGVVMAVLRGSGARRVLDVGCGEGRLIRELSKERQFEKITGMDVSHRALEMAATRLRLDRATADGRVQLLHGSLLYRDRRLEGFDAVAAVEVVEHLDPPRLAAFERVVFECARPRVVVLTTPNREYNVLFAGLAPPQEGMPGGLRHGDHRFEWTRAEFHEWARGVAERFAYAVRFLPVGQDDPTHGSPTQMAVFERSVSV